MIQWSSDMVVTALSFGFVQHLSEIRFKKNLLLCGITRKLEYFLCLILLQLQTQLLVYVNCPCSKYNSEEKNQAIVQKELQPVLLQGISSSMYEA